MPQSKPNNPYANPYLLKCFKCNQVGHKSNECPQRGILHIQQTTGDSEKEREDFIEIGNEETELVGGAEGDPLLCIIQKVLSSKVLENTQRNSIFKTKSTIKGKVYEVTVDSGNYENVVSKSLVKAL